MLQLKTFLTATLFTLLLLTSCEKEMLLAPINNDLQQHEYIDSQDDDLNISDSDYRSNDTNLDKDNTYDGEDLKSGLPTYPSCLQSDIGYSTPFVIIGEALDANGDINYDGNDITKGFTFYVLSNIGFNGCNNSITGYDWTAEVYLGVSDPNGNNKVIGTNSNENDGKEIDPNIFKVPAPFTPCSLVLGGCQDLEIDAQLERIYDSSTNNKFTVLRLEDTWYASITLTVDFAGCSSETQTFSISKFSNDDVKVDNPSKEYNDSDCSRSGSEDNGSIGGSTYTCVLP